MRSLRSKDTKNDTENEKQIASKEAEKEDSKTRGLFCISKIKSLVQQWNRWILTLFLFPRQNVKNIFFHVPVWFNSNIWNNSNSVFYKKVLKMLVILSSNGDFLSKNVFPQFKLHILKRKCAMQYNSIITAISSFWNVYHWTQMWRVDVDNVYLLFWKYFIKWKMYKSDL